MNMTIEQAVREFNRVYNDHSIVENQNIFQVARGTTGYQRLHKSAFYCGITKDIERRASEHNANILYYVKASSPQAATDLEERLGEEGYDIGNRPGNGATDDTVYVYMYRKSGNTVEHE